MRSLQRIRTGSDRIRTESGSDRPDMNHGYVLNLYFGQSLPLSGLMSSAGRYRSRV